MRWPHATGREAIVVLVAVAVGLLVFVPTFVPGAYGVAGHFECAPSAVLAETTLWTPLVLVNAPYQGNATVVVAVPAGPGIASATDRTEVSDGAAGGIFTLDLWQLERTTTTWQLGPGPDQRCTDPFRAVDLTRLTGPSAGSVLWTHYIRTPDPYSDRGEATNITGADPFNVSGPPATVEGSVLFSNGFLPRPDVGAFDSCGEPVGSSNSSMPTTSSSLSVTVPFSYGSGVEVNAVLSSSAEYTYSFAPPGIWQIEDTTPAGGGDAFAFLPCGG